MRINVRLSNKSRIVQNPLLTVAIMSRLRRSVRKAIDETNRCKLFQDFIVSIFYTVNFSLAPCDLYGSIFINNTKATIRFRNWQSIIRASDTSVFIRINCNRISDLSMSCVFPQGGGGTNNT